jgi:hypothetical protein
VQIACECERAKATSKLYHNRRGVHLRTDRCIKAISRERGGKGARGPSHCASGLQLAGVQPLGPPPANHNPRINKLHQKKARLPLNFEARSRICGRSTLFRLASRLGRRFGWGIQDESVRRSINNPRSTTQSNFNLGELPLVGNEFAIDERLKAARVKCNCIY